MLQDARSSSWTIYEDRVLRRKFAVYGDEWNRVAEFLPGRNREACRSRFQELLSASSQSKGTDCKTVTLRSSHRLRQEECSSSWSTYEDRVLRRKFAVYGDEWNRIAEFLPGRNRDTCRLRFHELLSASKEASVPKPKDSSLPSVQEEPSVDGNEVKSTDSRAKRTTKQAQLSLHLPKGWTYSRVVKHILKRRIQKKPPDSREKVYADIMGVRQHQERPLYRKFRTIETILRARLRGELPAVDTLRVLSVEAREAINAALIDNMSQISSRRSLKSKSRNKTPSQVTARTRWTPEEDRKLLEKRSQGIQSWDEIVRFLPGRTTTACRLRYLKFLAPVQPKRCPYNWTVEEDEVLREKVACGDYTWKQIAEFLPGRSTTACQLRFYKVSKSPAQTKKRPEKIKASDKKQLKKHIKKKNKKKVTMKRMPRWAMKRRKPRWTEEEIELFRALIIY